MTAISGFFPTVSKQWDQRIGTLNLVLSVAFLAISAYFLLASYQLLPPGINTIVSAGSAFKILIWTATALSLVLTAITSMMVLQERNSHVLRKFSQLYYKYVRSEFGEKPICLLQNMPTSKVFGADAHILQAEAYRKQLCQTILNDLKHPSEKKILLEEALQCYKAISLNKEHREVLEGVCFIEMLFLAKQILQGESIESSAHLFSSGASQEVSGLQLLYDMHAKENFVSWTKESAVFSLMGLRVQTTEKIPTSGTFLLNVFEPGENEGHTCLLHFQGDEFYFADPNLALYKFKQSEFLEKIGKWLKICTSYKCATEESILKAVTFEQVFLCDSQWVYSADSDVPRLIHRIKKPIVVS